MKTKTPVLTPEKYLASVPAVHRKDVAELDALIRKSAPGLKPYIQSGMLGYGQYSYKYGTGREGQWCTIGLSSRKKYISLYVCAVDGGQYVPERYKDALPKADIGKSCVRFKRLSDVDRTVLDKMIRHAAKVAPKA